MRIRDKQHLECVRSHDCLNCRTDYGVIPHHLLKCPDQKKGTGLKLGDNWTIPLCCLCHGALHAAGSEVKFFGVEGAKTAIKVAQDLWRKIEEVNAATELTKQSQELGLDPC